MSERRFGRRWPSIGTHATLGGAAVVMVFPFVWQIMTAFKTQSGAISVPPTFLPATWDLGNFAEALDRAPFFTMAFNSTASAGTRALTQALLCSMAGYAFARLRFPGREPLFVVLLAIMMVPRELYLIPQLEIMRELGWLNTLAGLIAPGLFSAFGTFVMRQFFATLPSSLEDAAKIDGAGVFRTFFSIMLPLAKPGIIAVVIFATLWSWNELLWPLIVNSDADKLTLSAGLSTLSGEYIVDFPVLMAGALMAQLPMIVFFLILQRRFIEGIAFTGMKS